MMGPSMAAHADAVLAQLFKTLQQRRNADPKSSYWPSFARAAPTGF